MDQDNGSSRASQADATTWLFVVGRIGGLRYAWPAASVERVLPMAAVTHVADLPPDVAGLIDVHGDTLAVVDPRGRLGLPPQAPHPEQHLLLVHTPARFLLWVDGIEAIVTVSSTMLEEVQADAEKASALFIIRVDGQLVPVLSAAAFDPGPIVRAAHAAR